MKTVTVETAEFRLSDGTSVVWHKEPTKWGVNIYKHAHLSRYVSTVGKLPSVENAKYFTKNYQLKPVKD